MTNCPRKLRPEMMSVVVQCVDWSVGPPWPSEIRSSGMHDRVNLKHEDSAPDSIRPLHGYHGRRRNQLGIVAIRNAAVCPPLAPTQERQRSGLARVLPEEFEVLGSAIRQPFLQNSPD
jgi:hypothetical protein